MDKIVLAVTTRSKDTSVRESRREGRIPCIVYGNTPNTMLMADEKLLRKAHIHAGESTLVQLDHEGKTIPVLFHSVDLDPVTDRIIHVDFLAVNMKVEVEATVHIRHEGEAPAVKDFNANIVTPLHEVTVRALPANLPHDLVVDLSKLTEIDSTITVADIVVPEGVTILNEPDEILVIAQEQRVVEPEEEVVAPVAEGEAAAGDAPAEGAEGEKKEGE